MLSSLLKPQSFNIFWCILQSTKCKKHLGSQQLWILIAAIQEKDMGIYHFVLFLISYIYIMFLISCSCACTLCYTHVSYIGKDGKDQTEHLLYKICFLNKTDICRVNISICFIEGMTLQYWSSSFSI